MSDWKSRATKAEPEAQSWRSRAAPVEEEAPMTATWSPEMPEPLQVTPMGLIKGAVKSLPAAGAGAGALLSGGNPLVTAGGAALGAGIKGMAESFMEPEPLRAPTIPGTLQAVQQQASDVALETGLQHAPGLLRGLVPRRIVPALKPGAQDIEAAAKLLGTEATAGQVLEPGLLSMTESNISKQHTWAGQNIRNKIAKGTEGTKALFPKPNKTEYEMAQDFRKATGEGIREKVSPAIKTYEKIGAETPKIPISARSKRVSINIRNLPYAKVSGSSDASLANTVANNLDEMTTLDELRNLKSWVNGQMRGKLPGSTERLTLSKIAEKLTNLENHSIVKAAVENAKTERQGLDLAKEMIGEVRAANALYADVSESTKRFSEALGMGRVKTYQDFLKRLESPKFKSQKMLNVFFNADNLPVTKEFRNNFPAAFEKLRTAKLRDIYLKSLNSNDDLVPSKLISNIGKISPEQQQMLFKEYGTDAVNAIKKYYKNIPKDLNTSGTAAELRAQDRSVWNGFGIMNELIDAMRLGAVKAGKKIAVKSPLDLPKSMFTGKKQAIPLTGSGLIKSAEEE